MLQPLRTGSDMPSLEDVQWVDGIAATPERLAGKPVLVHFWSISCSICHDVADEVARWRADYEPRGLEIVSIHQPRSPQELDPTAITADAKTEMRIEWPCAIDNEHTIVQRFANQYVPAYYLFDANHKLVHRQAGDRGFERLHDKINAILERERAA